MATTIQAQRLIDAMKAAGLKHGSWKHDGDFTVRTDIKRKVDRGYSGLRYSEYGDAMVHWECRSDRKREAIFPLVDRFAREEFQVIVMVNGDDEIFDVIVSSRHNPSHQVSTFKLATAEWERRTAVEA